MSKTIMVKMLQCRYMLGGAHNPGVTRLPAQQSQAQGRATLNSRLGFTANVDVVSVQTQLQELNCSRKKPGYFTPIGDKAPCAARDSSQVARV